MQPSLYHPLFLALTALLCLVAGGRGLASPDHRLQVQGSHTVVPLAISAALALWLGMRPVSFVFGDTVMYAHTYKLLRVGLVAMDWHGEWLWQGLMMACKAAGLGVRAFFAVVEAGYVFSVFWAVKRFCPANPLMGLLFVAASLMFFSYGTNGIRNGLACHLLLLAMTFLFDDRRGAAALLALAAFGIHRTTALPIAATLAGMYVVKDPRHAVGVWIASIVVSLTLGDAFTDFFTSLGFDDRMTLYTSGTIDERQFSKVGFRWDFLLYSSVPVAFYWYVSVWRGLRDDWYNVVGAAYCLCNAFWVLVIRSAFSNRFAYLSWFLYPIMIAYPLINLPVWERQDSRTGQILLAYCAFTVFMQLVVWGGQ